MTSEAIKQLTGLLSQASELRESLSNVERQQLMGITGAFLGELERPDEAVYRITFNEVSTTLHRSALRRVPEARQHLESFN
ncbi:uncharacterized protein HMPREF1541_03965 [Cyphellophora europaea CBS 101466]|uniref:Uncharacterized protein n=1 Tax=Cyphellophora europaea (strain CBS 101466) TaxID=1220924 RepID=W2RZW9_CYPE1|nr:uncharacterized protein HMPREF1541_03965 [Cyphellophora europaea CBS 101466]ETN42026.1 hypothetical protein HMPREF1541_03965 [Cyphellophora europaea CBS 101466]